MLQTDELLLYRKLNFALFSGITTYILVFKLKVLGGRNCMSYLYYCCIVVDHREWDCGSMNLIGFVEMMLNLSSVSGAMMCLVDTAGASSLYQ
jgi:hypothetical protein